MASRKRKSEEVPEATAIVISMFVEDERISGGERGLILTAPNSYPMQLDAPGVTKKARCDTVPGLKTNPSTGEQPFVTIVFDGWQYDERALKHLRKMVDIATPIGFQSIPDDFLRCHPTLS